MPTQQERNWALWFHIGVLVMAALTSWAAGIAGAVTALAVYMIAPLGSAFVKDHAREAFNFNTTMFLLSVIGYILAFITLGVGLLVIAPIAVILMVVWVVCTILAAIAAGKGERYHFPFAIQFIKPNVL